MLMASQIATFLGLGLVGDDCPVTSPKPLSEAEIGSVCFGPDSLSFFSANGVSSIPCERPRLAFARVLSRYFLPAAGLAISTSAVIHECVKIGGNCRIKSNAVIGEEGFGFERNEMGVPVRLLHLGGVTIGNNVEVGACTVIARGTLSDTVIKDNVKLDDRVFVAHNVNIGESSMVVACAEISGSVTIGKRVWVGANACIKEGVTVGDDALIGMGAVVLRDVEPNAVVVGNPAKFLRWREK